MTQRNATLLADNRDYAVRLADLQHEAYILASGEEAAEQTDRRGKTGWGGRQDPALTVAPGWAAPAGGLLWGWARHRT